MTAVEKIRIDKAIENLVKVRGMIDKLDELHVCNSENEFGVHPSDIAIIKGHLMKVRDRVVKVIDEDDL